jgi:hypothetical protein
LNGRRVRDPEAPVRLEHDHITVDRVPIQAQPKLSLVMNKPRGLVTTASDEGGRATVYDLLKPTVAPPRLPAAGTEWVGPVGRLDKASEGYCCSRMIRSGRRRSRIQRVVWRSAITRKSIASQGMICWRASGEVLRSTENAYESKRRASCDWEARIVGWKFLSTKGRTGIFDVCWKGWTYKSCG